jgi:hypothetical protein
MAYLGGNYGAQGKRLDPIQIEAWLRDADCRPPDGVTPQNWLRFVADARKFVADGWLERAIKLEWLDVEVFSVDGKIPLDNLEPARTALVPSLAGRAVKGLTPDYAVVKNLAGEDCKLHSRHLQYQARTKALTPLVLIWELPVLTETN